MVIAFKTSQLKRVWKILEGDLWLRLCKSQGWESPRPRSSWCWGIGLPPLGKHIWRHVSAVLSRPHPRNKESERWEWPSGLGTPGHPSHVNLSYRVAWEPFTCLSSSTLHFLKHMSLHGYLLNKWINEGKRTGIEHILAVSNAFWGRIRYACMNGWIYGKINK